VRINLVESGGFLPYFNIKMSPFSSIIFSTTEVFFLLNNIQIVLSSDFELFV
jgi:hypothetical protein